MIWTRTFFAGVAEQLHFIREMFPNEDGRGLGDALVNDLASGILAFYSELNRALIASGFETMGELSLETRARGCEDVVVWDTRPDGTLSAETEFQLLEMLSREGLHHTEETPIHVLEKRLLVAIAEASLGDEDEAQVRERRTYLRASLGVLRAWAAHENVLLSGALPATGELNPVAAREHSWAVGFLTPPVFDRDSHRNPVRHMGTHMVLHWLENGWF